MEYSYVHPMPGHGLPLDYYPTESEPLYVGKPLPTALLEDSITSVTFVTDEKVRSAFLPLLTLREFSMLQFMDKVTDKEGWQTKVFDTDIIEKWRKEVKRLGLTKATYDHCIAELQYKAKNIYQGPNTPIAVYNGDVVKSDAALPESVKLALQDAVRFLEQVPDKDKDWHPGSNEMVLDLVHPSLFPLVYGKTRVLAVGENVVGLKDCVARCGEGNVLEMTEKLKPKTRKGTSHLDPYSFDYQWLPCEVDISGESARIISYINNLHPDHVQLYKIIEQVIDAAIPLWERTLAPLYQEDFKYNRRIPCWRSRYRGDGEERSRFEKEGDEKDPENWDEDEEEDVNGNDVGAKDVKDGNAAISSADTNNNEDDGEGDSDEGEVIEDDGNGEWEDEDNDDDDDDGWSRPLRDLLYPNAVPFNPDKLTIPKPVNFRELYGNRGRPLQVIVKLANIELTPEKPKYEGGSWHVEGKQNEHICATALYYYSSSNIKSSELAFRQFIDQDWMDYENFDYRQYEHDFLPEYFGIETEEAGIQDVGKVETKEGRLLTFPNILQHQVQPFELEDPTKPGHRKILALFLVDPNVRIISTAHVPSQRLDWWRDAATAPSSESVSDDTAKGLDLLPWELKEKVFDEVDGFPISLAEAKKTREKLMDERKKFVKQHATAVEANNQFSLCEH